MEFLSARSLRYSRVGDMWCLLVLLHPDHQSRTLLVLFLFAH